jgi:hypothetical protein
VKASEHPGFAPREEDMQYARKVLELAYYRRDLHTSEDSEDTSDVASACREKLRRVRGEEKEVVFWDNADSDRAECHSEGDAIDCVMELLEDIGFHTLSDPAENKWLSVFPVICALTTMMCCHQVFLSALRFSCSVAEGEDDGLSAPSEGEALGAISKDSWAKRERRRQVKALVWSEDKSSKFCCLLFCLVASRVMSYITPSSNIASVLHFAKPNHTFSNSAASFRMCEKLWQTCGVSYLPMATGAV